MNITLNETQKELIKLAKEKGFLTPSDFDIYSSPISAKRNIKRFILAGLLKDSNNGRFEYIGGKK